MLHQELKTDKTIKERIGQILCLLEGEYGTPKWQPSYAPISVLVQTILSQNTSDTNSGSAFKTLKSSFDNWESVADADADTIAHYIRHGGLGQIKAQRIKQALQGIVRERGQLELEFLSQFTSSDAEEWLLRLPGVGLKTARCVLLFALGMPSLPVDTHVLRVSKRLGLINPKASLDEAHYTLGALVPQEDVYKFHVLVIEHGRKICQARRPNCQDCILKKICPSRSL
ncbi:endonuclease III domain-containing protein [Chloroflexota bacterium]